jgi:hypothetical protein
VRPVPPVAPATSTVLESLAAVTAALQPATHIASAKKPVRNQLAINDALSMPCHLDYWFGY